MPNRKQKREKEIFRIKQEMLDRLKEAGTKAIISINSFGFPEVDFPSLEELAEEFAEKNNLSLTDMTDYHFPVVAPLNEPRTYDSGLILQFKEGVSVLSIKGNWEDEGRLEPTYGGRPIQYWSKAYVMSGLVKGEDAELGARISYSRPTRREERTNTLGRTLLVDVPFGEARKRIHRYDNSSLWFLKEQDRE